MSEEQQKATVAEVLIHCIKPAEVALRAVDTTSEEFLGLVSSIERDGILNAISVTDLGDGTYGLVDGLHRYTAAKAAGLKTLPVVIKDLDAVRLMEAQIIANIHKVDTKPVDYTKQLYRLMNADPLMTIGDLASRLSRPVSWLNQRLSLSNLTKPIQELVNEGQINLSNAYALAKLPQEEQAEYVDRAQTDPPGQFVPVVSQRVKQIRDANKKGKDAAPAEFEPISRLISKKDVEAVLNNPSTVAAKVLEEEGVSDLQGAFTAALKWVLNLNKSGVEEQRARYEQRKAQLKEAQEKAKKQREEKRQEEAARRAADVSQL